MRDLGGWGMCLECAELLFLGGGMCVGCSSTISMQSALGIVLGLGSSSVSRTTLDSAHKKQ